MAAYAMQICIKLTFILFEEVLNPLNYFSEFAVDKQTSDSRRSKTFAVRPSQTGGGKSLTPPPPF